ncbi:diacylglycerol kinase family protein [Candidatus Microgenomates bacterium]|nr:MAG: diacylglycerol kinase family protein [Candidatus Microgenomates bacterium]
MEEIIQKHHVSFKNAFSGLFWALKTQPNFRIHLSIATAVVVLGLYVGLTSYEWLILTFTIFWALAAEMINTAIEAVCDLVTHEWKEEIKIAKDVSAAMMLVTALGSAIIAAIIFLPKLIVLM